MPCAVFFAHGYNESEMSKPNKREFFCVSIDIPGIRFDGHVIGFDMAIVIASDNELNLLSRWSGTTNRVRFPVNPINVIVDCRTQKKERPHDDI